MSFGTSELYNCISIFFLVNSKTIHAIRRLKTYFSILIKMFTTSLMEGLDW